MTGADLYADYVRAANRAALFAAENMLLRAALFPFATIGADLPSCLPSDACVMFGRHAILASNLRDAYNTMHLFDDPAGSSPQTTEATASESSPEGPSSTTTEAP